MKARPEFRDRDETEVAILDELVDRRDDGMTVFELRSSVDLGIDEIEPALGALKEDELIDATQEGRRTVIRPDERVVPDAEPENDDSSFLDDVIDRIRP